LCSHENPKHVKLYSVRAAKWKKIKTRGEKEGKMRTLSRLSRDLNETRENKTDPAKEVLHITNQA